MFLLRYLNRAVVGGESFSTAVLLAAKWLISPPPAAAPAVDHLTMTSSLHEAPSSGPGALSRAKPSMEKTIEASKKEAVLYQGDVSKRGQLNTSLKQRYFVLTTKSLKYYQNRAACTSGGHPQGVLQIAGIEARKSPDTPRQQSNAILRVARAASISSPASIVGLLGGVSAGSPQQSASPPANASGTPAFGGENEILGVRGGHGRSAGLFFFVVKDRAGSSEGISMLLKPYRRY